MKLQQGQVWKREGEYLRIIVLQRLAVEYKSTLDPKVKEGTHIRATKKEFCRLLKGATLLPAVALPGVKSAPPAAKPPAAPAPAAPAGDAAA